MILFFFRSGLMKKIWVNIRLRTAITKKNQIFRHFLKIKLIIISHFRMMFLFLIYAAASFFEMICCRSGIILPSITFHEWKLSLTIPYAWIFLINQKFEQVCITSSKIIIQISWLLRAPEQIKLKRSSVPMRQIFRKMKLS